jgi:hypothetical protein
MCVLAVYVCLVELLLLLLSTDGSYDAGDGLLLTATPLP